MTTEEFHQALASLTDVGVFVDARTTEFLIEAFDVDGDGSISYDEFLDMLLTDDAEEDLSSANIHGGGGGGSGGGGGGGGAAVLSVASASENQPFGNSDNSEDDLRRLRQMEVEIELLKKISKERSLSLSQTL